MIYETTDITELHALPDDAVVNVREAAVFCRMSFKTLDSYRTKIGYTHRGPKFLRTSARAIKYRMGDLRAYLGLPLKGEG